MADNGRKTGPRCIAIVGPFASGKTSLLEEILARTGTIDKPGAVADGSSVGDCSPEARAHAMSVELNVAEVTFMDEAYTFIDCPGSVEFNYESDPVLGRRRCGDRRRRARREEDSGAAGRAARPRGAPHSPFPVPEQDRQGVDGRARRAGAAAAGFRDPAGAPPDPDLEGRGGDRLHRPRARPRLRLPPSTRRARSSRSTTASARAATRRASPCWSGSPITTTR